METGSDEIRVVQAAYASYARRDFDALLDAFSQDAIWDANDALWTTGMFYGRDGIRDYFRQLGELWDEVRLDDYDIEVVRAGTVLVRGRLRGRERASGVSADVPFVHWVDVGPDGRIDRLRILVDPDRPR